MNTAKVQNHEYLDIWRGALYSVIIGQIVFSNKKELMFCAENGFFMFFLLITILMDCYVRFTSRSIIREQCKKNEYKISWFTMSPVSVEIVLFLLEIIGLLLLALSVVSLSKEINLNHTFLIMYLLTVVAHNIFMVAAEENITFFDFFINVIFGNILNTDFGKRWATSINKEKELAEIKAQNIRESNSHKTTSHAEEVVDAASELSKSKIIISLKKMIAQFYAMHIVHLNLVYLLVLIVYKYKWLVKNNFDGYNPEYTVIIAMIAVFICYYNYWPKQKIAYQILGNIGCFILIANVLLLIAKNISFFAVIIFMFIEQLGVSIMLLVLPKKTGST